jgi:hypothetical protein
VRGILLQPSGLLKLRSTGDVNWDVRVRGGIIWTNIGEIDYITTIDEYIGVVTSVKIFKRPWANCYVKYGKFIGK